jgi:hypothetical protein
MGDNLSYSETELLLTHNKLEQAVINGVKIHGGFDDSGNYRSPRTLYRSQAIDAWSRNHEKEFGTKILDVPLSLWPAHYPSTNQMRFLIKNNINYPMIATLTRIGAVEGYGGYLRYLIVPDIQKYFADDIKGTALEHLEKGLIEAHSRDEAGFENEAGHSEMWYLVRDIAFEYPFSAKEHDECLKNMGLLNMAGLSAAGFEPEFNIEPALEQLIRRLIGILLIEIRAYLVFAWAEELLSDLDLVAGNGISAKIVSYIRQDESPHVAYLKCVLTEIRDRRLKTLDGKTLSGKTVIEKLLNKAMRESITIGEERARTSFQDAVDYSLVNHPRKKDILAQLAEIK